MQVTSRGHEVLALNPTPIHDLYLQRFEEFRDFKERSIPEAQLATTESDAPSPTTTPEETISKAVGLLDAELRDELLEKLSKSHPIALKD